MTAYSSTARATHLVTTTAWFGESLMSAVALNLAARQRDDSHQGGVAGLLYRASSLVHHS